MFITLFDRTDRLGANITMYIAQLLYAVQHKVYIQYDRPAMRYSNSIFVDALFDYIDRHNAQCEKTGTSYIPWSDQNDWISVVSLMTKDVQCDLFSFFRAHIFPGLRLSFYSLAAYKNYSVPFDPSKTILVHLRLEDVANEPDYDGRVCVEHYRPTLEANQVCVSTHNSIYNRQAPLSPHKLEEQLANICTTHNDHTVIVITSPGSTPTLPYKCIRSADESYDLFLLCMCDVIVLSRSTFAMAALFFGNYKEAYVPLWGHMACMGLSTKYDRSKFHYFY
jgi:hypothetical protein